MAAINCAEVGNRHFNRAGSSWHPAICSNIKGAVDRGDDLSSGDSLLPAWRKLVFLKMRVVEACIFEALQDQVGCGARFFAASNAAADGICESLKKIRGAAAGQGVADDAGDGI